MFIRYAVSLAIKHGCDVCGFFAYTLMDCFEWNHGYSKKFGLFEVEFEGGKVKEYYMRTGSDYYRDVIDKFNTRG